MSTTNGSFSKNSAFGANALKEIKTGDENTGMGYSSLKNIKTGQKNTGVGSHSLEAINGGSNNTAIGFNAGGNLRPNSFNNTIIGYQLNSVANKTTVDNIAIGYRAADQLSNTSGRLIIANGSTANDTWIFGDNNHNVGIGYDPATNLFSAALLRVYNRNNPGDQNFQPLLAASGYTGSSKNSLEIGRKYTSVGDVHTHSMRIQQKTNNTVKALLSLILPSVKSIMALRF